MEYDLNTNNLLSLLSLRSLLSQFDTIRRCSLQNVCVVIVTDYYQQFDKELLFVVLIVERPNAYCLPQGWRGCCFDAGSSVCLFVY